MIEDILSPVEQFPTYKEKFREVAEKTFEELTSAAGIDPEANRILCREIQDLKSNNAKTTTTLRWWTILCVFMYVVAAVCIIICISKGFQNGLVVPILCILGAIAMLVFLFWKIHPIIKKYKLIKNELETQNKNK